MMLTQLQRRHCQYTVTSTYVSDLLRVPCVLSIALSL